MRETRQRREIRAVFERAGRPMSPAEIHEAARAGGGARRLGLATVYRTVKGLLESGWLAEVAVPGEPPRYEPAGKHHHHHFHCRSCGRLYELEGCGETLSRIRPPKGFAVDSHELTLYGRCAACR